jgi:hypothetical protein
MPTYGLLCGYRVSIRKYLQFEDSMVATLLELV